VEVFPILCSQVLLLPLMVSQHWILRGVLYPFEEKFHVDWDVWEHDHLFSMRSCVTHQYGFRAEVIFPPWCHIVDAVNWRSNAHLETLDFETTIFVCFKKQGERVSISNDETMKPPVFNSINQTSFFLIQV
jgi:hypothetical protein